MMRWEIEMEEVEAVLERIWDLHDKISDAIHAISRSHFLRSVKPELKRREAEVDARGAGEEPGFVFMKGVGVADDEALAEARSLNAIRTALESLEDRLEFFHTVQSQQRAERDAALKRLEQSRLILAMRLAEHQGKKYKVIEEARAFVGEVQDTAGHFVAPESLFEKSRNHAQDNKAKGLGFLMHMLISSFSVAKRTIRLENIGCVLGNAALFAVSMLALLQLHQVAGNGDTLGIQDPNIYRNRTEKNLAQLDSSLQSSQPKQFDVFSARG